MFITLVSKKSYNEKPTLDTWSKRTQTNPNLPTYMVGKFALSLSKGLLKQISALFHITPLIRVRYASFPVISLIRDSQFDTMVLFDRGDLN